MDFLRCLALQEKKLNDSSRLDVVEIAHVSEHASEFVSFLVGLRTYQHHGMTYMLICHCSNNLSAEGPPPLQNKLYAGENKKKGPLPMPGIEFCSLCIVSHSRATHSELQ